MKLIIALFIIIAVVGAILRWRLYKSSYSNSVGTIETKKREYILENRAQFGVTNHGTSFDELNEIYSLSPGELGLKN